METKADILYSHGFFSEALRFYNISIKKNHNNYYVKKHKLTYIRYLDITNHK